VSVAKFRIPRIAAAALVLGSTACGDDDGGPPGGSSAGVNVSRSRVRAIGRAICKQDAACRDDSEDYGDYGDYGEPTVDECTSELVDDFFSEFGELLDDSDGKKCLDSLLDAYSCYATLSCASREADDLEKCGAAFETYYALCDGLIGSSDYSYDFSSSGRRQRVKRGLRIPR
jgi:hypothetical protein